MTGNNKVLMNVLHNSLEVLIFSTKCHLSTAVLFDHGSFRVCRQKRGYSYETCRVTAYSGGGTTKKQD